MNIDLTRNYFELFSFPIGFEINQDLLAEKYRELQTALHPDRFADASDQERRISVQTTAYVNEAYTTLKSDLKRAHYLLTLNNIEVNADTETSSDAEFLMQQMELHERVENIENMSDPLQALSELHADINQQQENLSQRFAGEFKNNDLQAAKDTALKLQFFNRLRNSIKKKQEIIEEELL